MSGLPGDWFGLLVVVYLLGLRHGMDPDHLATIDGLTRLNLAAKPRLARWSGALFSLGHCIVVIALTVFIGLMAAQWNMPQWLDSTGAWISIAFLISLGLFNIFAVLNAAPDDVVRPAGFKSRIACTCCSVCPVPPGNTVQPSAWAPLSIIEPAGTKW